MPARVSRTLSRSNQAWHLATEENYRELRARSLQYIASNRRPELGAGGYAYQTGGPALLYASAYAVLTRHLCGDLDTLSSAERTDWVSYLQSFQSEDGLFRDPLIACDLAETCDWWGWKHQTLHVLMALTALGGVAQSRFLLLEPFRSKHALESWLAKRDWNNDPANASNEVQNVGTLMQYARDFQGDPRWSDPVNWLLDWLASMQDPKTGLWGARFDNPYWLSQGVQTGYHLWLLFSYDRRPLRYPDQIVRSCINTQNRYGGFAPTANSSACEDIDSIDPLSRIANEASQLKSLVSTSLRRAVPWVLANANPDGSWVFRRHQAFAYGHTLMTTAPGRGALFPTWFRILSLAFCAQALSDHPAARLRWSFLECPGHQFWRS